MRRSIVIWMSVIVASCSSQSQPLDEFTLKVIPEAIGDTIPGQRCIILVSVETSQGGVGEVAISASASGADVSIENAAIEPGEFAEVTATMRPPAIEISDESQAPICIVTVQAEREGVSHQVDVPIAIASEEEDLVAPAAEEVRNLFIPLLAINRPDLGIDAQTEWTGTIVRPHILVVTHYLYFSGEWEMHVFWHVMIPPHDWARIELRRRLQESVPSLAFEIPSRSAIPLEFEEIAPEGQLWR